MASATRILIVDDNDSILEALQKILRAAACTVIGEAHDGAQAVALAKRLQPDIILMDIEMPNLNGIAAARHIQKHQPTPIILLTVHDTPELIEQAREAGVVGYLVKPPDANEIIRTIKIAMSRFNDFRELQRLNAELERLNRELETRNAQLQKAMAAIKTLKGLVPICAWCGKKIQDEDGTWVQLETYIAERSEAEFTHGICPDCLEKWRKSQRKKKSS
jgi:AmiR/NasT family two-component response regulator